VKSLFKSILCELYWRKDYLHTIKHYPGRLKQITVYLYVHFFTIGTFMYILNTFEESLRTYIQNGFGADPFIEGKAECTLNTDESKQEFGDISTNVAMILAQQLKRNPRDIAAIIQKEFHHPTIARIEVAGPGFLNIFLTEQIFQVLAEQLYMRKQTFFKACESHIRERVSLEFVSANPTGPLHFGHGRGGIIGDVLANVMTFVGHTVTKEYYINDAGLQIIKLGISLKVRCQQACGLDVQLPEEGYAGDYLIDLAQQCIQEYGVAVLSEKDTFFQEYAKEKLLLQIKKTLTDYGITFDVWFSEKRLHIDGAIEATLHLLEAKGYLYRKEGALWFKSTDFGDDKDRVMKKSSGELTYVAADAAYLRNKAERGFDRCIIVLGYDHHGYVQRLAGLRQALGIPFRFDAILYQLVKIKSEGKQVRMSKRAGAIVTLDQVIEQVGAEVARFFYVNRKADAQLEFDLDLAMTKTEENPVYYIQYAYVRIKSIFAKAKEQFPSVELGDIQYVSSPDDRLMLKKIIALKPLLLHMSQSYQTHLLSYYTIELAQAFHRYYGKYKILDPLQEAQSRGRLLLLQLLEQNFELCMQLLGIERLEKM